LAGAWATGAPGETVRVRGNLVLTARGEADALARNELNKGDGPHDVLRLRLFVEGAPSERVQVYTQLLLDEFLRTGLVNLYGAYVLYEVVGDGRLYVEAGKIPSPFGVYAERDYPEKSALIGVPFAYFHHTTILPDRLPLSADDLLAIRGLGQTDTPTYPSQSEVPGQRHGLPPVYAACWDVGAVLLGATGPLEYRLGVTQGTPGSPVAGKESNESKGVAGRLGWVPRPGVRIGVSGATGAYLPESAGPLPEGRSTGAYAQSLLGGDLELSAGRWTLWSEGIFNRFESPWIEDDLDLASYYLELQRRLAPGWDLAMRWDEIRFSPIRDSAGHDVRWDQSLRRLEIGSQYDLTREAALEATVQFWALDVSGFDPKETLGALQFIVRF
jgi:hypothetical protein